MEPVFGVRRDPPPDLDAVGEDEALAGRIRAEIERDGPIPFARFMDLALYDPAGGYYRATDGSAGPGRRLPDRAGAASGVRLGTRRPSRGCLAAARRAEPVRRCASTARGRGRWSSPSSTGSSRTGSPLLDALAYDPVEVEPGRLAAIDARLSERGAAGLRLGPDDRHGPVTGVVLANEVLDALPVHRVRWRGDRLVEIAVGLEDGAFVDVETAPSTPALAARLADEGVDLVDGQTAEICLGVDRWVAETAAGLERGLLLLIDYGAPASELYDPVRRRDGTLLAYVRHRASHDPYAHVGRQDLTAHVDVTAVERAAAAAGLSHLATTTQAELLVGLGTETLLREVQEDPATSLEAYLELRSSLMRLLDPSAMGRFRVMAFGRDWPDGPPLDGLSFRAPGRPPSERMPAD